VKTISSKMFLVMTLHSISKEF